MCNSLPTRVVRVLVLMEGGTITGPAKNVLEFCRISRCLGVRPVISTSIASFVRVTEGGREARAASNQILDAASAMGLEAYSIPERFPFDPRVVYGLRRLVGLLQPDIIQTHHVKSHFLVRLSGLARRYRWIAFHHGYTIEGIRMRLYDQLDRWSLKAPSQVVTVCESFRRHLVSLGVSPSRILVLHNAIPADWLHGGEQTNFQTDVASTEPEQNVTKRHRNERVVLAVGRLSGEKAFTDLIVAIDQLRRERPELCVRLMIVGDGPERSQIERAARDFRLQDRVTLLGHVQDVRSCYRRADVLAISSLTEGSPNVLLEAMAAGVPVIATSVGGIPEVVTDKETGLLVGPRDPQAMASAINLLFSNPVLARRLACNAQELIRQQYSPQDRAQFLLGLYERISRS